MKANELMECIHSGEIKENSKIKVMTEDRLYITTIEYKNGRLEWKSGEFDTSYLCSIFTEFEVIKEDEIDIQAIEELNIEKMMTHIAVKEKINELIRAIKQLDKQIHCKVCKKELATKYGVCEKCYENVNEDVR